MFEIVAVSLYVNLKLIFLIMKRTLWFENISLEVLLLSGAISTLAVNYHNKSEFFIIHLFKKVNASRMIPFHKIFFFHKSLIPTSNNFSAFIFKHQTLFLSFIFSLKFKHITYVKEWLQFKHLLWHDKESYTIHNRFLPLPEIKIRQFNSF